MKTPSASASARKVQVSPAHPASPRFRLSDPPAKTTPKPRAAYVKKQKKVQSLATKAIQYLFENLGEWAVVGTYSIPKRSTKAGIEAAKKANYARVWYAQQVLDDALATAIAYCSTSYQVDSRIDWSADGKARELRFRVIYLNAPDEYDNGMCEIHSKIESDNNYRMENTYDEGQAFADELTSIDAELEGWSQVVESDDGINEISLIAERMVKASGLRTDQVLPLALGEWMNNRISQ